MFRHFVRSRGRLLAGIAVLAVATAPLLVPATANAWWVGGWGGGW